MELTPTENMAMLEYKKMELEEQLEKIKHEIAIEKEKAQLREVTIIEVGEVAKGVTLGTAQNVLGVLTNSNGEPVINNDGQSHNDE